MEEKTLKQKTISGLSWSFFDRFANQIFLFIVGIVLARLLTPKEYGLTGMIAIFIAISNVFIISGFGEALIRKKDATTDDYSTVFNFNLIVSICCYFFIVLFSKQIGIFFNEPLLQKIINIFAISIIINALGLVPRVILMKQLDFKSLTKVSLTSTIISGIIAIYMAANEFGVWSLVWRGIIESAVSTLMLYWIGKPKLILKFNKNSFNELFGFSSKLLLSQLINEFFNNVYYLIIGKYFNAKELGLFTRAQNYSDLPSRTLNNVIQKVSYPVLAEIKDDPIRLKNAYKKLIKSTMFLTFLLMIGLATSAENVIIGLIGIKWKESVPYLQLLCFVGMLYPLHSLNLNMLNINGRSDLFLKLEIIKKILIIPVILIGIYIGIKAMIIGMIVNSLIAYFLNSFWSGRMVNYPTKEQIRDIAPLFGIAMVMGTVVYTIGYILNVGHLLALVLQILAGFFIVITLSTIIKLETYIEIKQIILDKLFSKKFLIKTV